MKTTLKSGSALVAVFWIMSILSLAVFTSIQLLYYEVDLVTSQVHGNRARHMAEMGIAVAANPVVDRDDPILKQTFGDGSTGFDAQLRSEASRFNINVMLKSGGEGIPPDKAFFREILARWGMEFDETQDIVDALVDWIDEDDFEELNGAEFQFYEDLGYLNRPYNRPFYSLDEVRLVTGWDRVEALNPNWQDWFTIWTTGGLDVNEADPELLAAAADITIDEAQDLQSQVLGPDGIRDTEDDVPFQDLNEPLSLLNLPEDQRALVEPRLTVNDKTSRIESVGWSGDIKRRITLVLRSRTGKPAILERREEVVP
jgi:general secretion pathway protein K